MPITYTWTATVLIGYPTFDEETDVVTRVSYTVLGDDGEGHTADYSNWQETPLDPSVPFIPYADLTNDIVIGWVQSNLGPDRVAAIEESIATVIQRQVTPPPEPEVLPLPWVPPAPVVEITPPLVEQTAPSLVVSEPASSDSLTESPVVIEPPAPDTSEPVN
jgi:hypothetical protein